MSFRWPFVALGIALYCTPGYGAAGPSATVNSYTPAQEKRADAAARSAGYTPGIVTMAQAGNLFLDATRGGELYSLTVTPDNKVFASTPVQQSPTG